MREWWIAVVYEAAEMAFYSKEEAIKEAWMNDETNVTHVIEYSAYQQLKEKLEIARECLAVISGCWRCDGCSKEAREALEKIK